MRRGRIAAGIALAAVGAAGLLAARGVERRVVRAAERMAAASGATVRQVRFSFLGPLRLEGVTLRPEARTSATVDAIDVRWRAAGGADPRGHVSGLAARGIKVQRGALAIELPAAAFDVTGWEASGGVEHLRLRQRPHAGTLDVSWTRRGGPAETRQALLGLDDVDVSAARVSWAGDPVLEPGRWSGRIELSGAGGRTALDGALSLRGARVSLGRALGGDEAAVGEPTDAVLAWSVRRERDVMEVPHAAVRLQGLRLEGRGRISGPAADARVEAALSAEAELGDALRTAGMRLPEPFEELAPEGRLGTARFEVTVRGPLADAAALRVVPRLRFEAAPQVAGAFRYLNHPFRYVPQPPGARIEVSAAAPDFVPLPGVPPLFVRMLLMSEDAGFYGHPGIDVAEIPVAWATNAERGGFARGASTITQQLARNLFLSRDKSYARKLEEAALALMMDSAVPKARLLEIYLNVIEWGPGIHGLGPAARHYFGKQPWQLTEKEMAFLVCLVPSPVRYHSAHRAGHVGPGMELLMQNLLARMHAASALSEEEYARARDEVLAFRPEDAEGPAREKG
jgi:hypothetical protein